MSSDSGPANPSFFDPFNPDGFMGDKAFGTHEGKKVHQRTALEEQQGMARDKRRNELRQAIVGDESMDLASRERLLAMFEQGKKNYEIAAELDMFKKQEGIYAINSKNAELVRALKEKPGRQQVILTQGAKQVSGAESTGLLTGITKL